jgi:predicted glycosyltransferase
VRAVLFCNEMLGLGHLRLSLALAGAVVASDAGSTALVVTGSPASGGFVLPEGVDVVKLPTAPVDAQSRWRATPLRPPAGLALDAAHVHALRAELGSTAVRELRPDVAIVDYRPLGRSGELVPALRWLRDHGGCTTALGLWDVDDDPERVDHDWGEPLLRSVRELYDIALVYGSPPPDDLRVARLRAAGVPVRSTGLVALAPAEHGPADLDPGYLLVTAGGGVDGYGLLAQVLAALRLEPLGRPALMVTGPLMPAAQVAALQRAGAGLDVRIETFRPDMDAVMWGARAIVSMAGYNTVAEVISSGKPALFAPRTFPREEQLNRARRWAAWGRGGMLTAEGLEPGALRRAVGLLLEQAPVPPQAPTGAADAVEILGEMSRGRRAG